MQKIRAFLAADDLPFWWRKGDTLRFAHVANFDAKKTSVVNKNKLYLLAHTESYLFC